MHGFLVKYLDDFHEQLENDGRSGSLSGGMAAVTSTQKEMLNSYKAT
jgi:hypothetical protein